MTFHKTLGFPKGLIVPNISLELKYTKHSLVKQKELKIMYEFKSIRPLRENLIEVDYENKTITHMVIRMSYNEQKDIIIVLDPNWKTKTAKVITVWLNNKHDLHLTLKKDQYESPDA